LKIQKNWLRVLIFAIILAVVIAGVWLSLGKILELIGFIVSLFLPFILGYGFSMLVNPLANFLQKKLAIPRGLSAVLVIILTIGIIGSAIGWAIFKIIEEARQLYLQFPQIYNSWQATIEEFTTKWEAIYVKLPINVQYMISGIGESVSGKLSGFLDNKSEPVVDYASRFAKAVPKGFVGVIVFILSSYFMIADNKTVSQTVNKMLGEKACERMNVVRSELRIYLGGYFKAQVILMFIVFAILLVELSVLRVSYALLIALGVAILDALPFFGSGLVLWPWAIISFATGDIKRGIGLVIVYVSIALIRRLAEPKLLSSRMGMNSILTLMSMYIGYRLLSLGGLILGPIIMMLGVSFYKAGVFDGIISFVKLVIKFIKEQIILLKNFFVKLTGSEWNE